MLRLSPVALAVRDLLDRDIGGVRVVGYHDVLPDIHLYILHVVRLPDNVFLLLGHRIHLCELLGPDLGLVIQIPFFLGPAETSLDLFHPPKKLVDIFHRV